MTNVSSSLTKRDPCYDPLLCMPTPFVFPDPGVHIAVSINVAAAAWNQAVGMSWPNVQFCETTPTSQSLPYVTPVPTPIPCAVSNTRPYDDGKDVKIVVKDGGSGSLLLSGWDRTIDAWLVLVLRETANQLLRTMMGEVAYLIIDKWFDTDNMPHCGRVIACVVPRPLINVFNLLPRFNPLSNQHLGDLTMIIEEPAWKFDEAGRSEHEKHIRIAWTSDLGQYNKYAASYRTSDGYKLEPRYLPAVLMHEFGHAAGLEDLYNFRGPYRGYLMHYYHPFEKILPRDAAYLGQVYRNEHGSEPHKR